MWLGRVGENAGQTRVREKWRCSSHLGLFTRKVSSSVKGFMRQTVFNFVLTRSINSITSKSPKLNTGMSLLSQIRCGTYLLGPKLASFVQSSPHAINAHFILNCPCCGSNTPESLSHLLLSCSAFSNQRTSCELHTAIQAAQNWLTEFGSYLPAYPVNFSNDEIIALMLIGGSPTITPGIAPSTKSWTSAWLALTLGHWRKTARFLIAINKRRSRIIHAINATFTSNTGSP